MELTLVLTVLLASAACLADPSVDDCPSYLERNAYLQAKFSYCFSFHLDDDDEYTDARDECERLGGRLVMPKTAELEEYLWQQLEYYNVDDDDYVWIGLNDRDDEDEYMWEDGTQLQLDDYNNWSENQGPFHDDKKHYIDDCTAIKMADGQWHDYTCGNDFYYVCQYDIPSK